jgi:hypothetical protein
MQSCTCFTCSLAPVSSCPFFAVIIDDFSSSSEKDNDDEYASLFHFNLILVVVYKPVCFYLKRTQALDQSRGRFKVVWMWSFV